MLEQKTSPKRRKAPKERRQLQLIKATIRTVARHGLSDATIATVAREAKLSQGIINLHFQSKDRLLVETLRHLAEEYRATWTAALEQGGDDPADKVARLVEVDFDRKVCDRNKLSVWFAFWGESKSRPTYRKICSERDRMYQEVMDGLCAEIVEQGPYPHVDPLQVATALSAMCQGLWLDLLLSPRSINPEQARGVCFGYLSSVFPRHFDTTGRIAAS